MRVTYILISIKMTHLTRALTTSCSTRIYTYLCTYTYVFIYVYSYHTYTYIHKYDTFNKKTHQHPAIMSHMWRRRVNWDTAEWLQRFCFGTEGAWSLELKKEPWPRSIFIYVYVYEYTYIYICLCVCIYVYNENPHQCHAVMSHAWTSHANRDTVERSKKHHWYEQNTHIYIYIYIYIYTHTHIHQYRYVCVYI